MSGIHSKQPRPSSRSFAILPLLLALLGCGDSPATGDNGAVASAGTAAGPAVPAAAGTSATIPAAAGTSARPAATAGTGAGGRPAANGGSAGAVATGAAGTAASVTAGAAAPDGPISAAAGTTASAAGSGAPAAGSGAAGSGSAGAAGGAPTTHEDLGMGDGSDVVTVGDSWMSYAINGGGIERGLLEASGQPYRTYGVAGTMLLDEVIPNQYETAKRQNPDIKTVVMTGGGNDLLLTGMTAGGCGAGCMSTIDQVTERLKKMWEEMAADGVQDIVYIEYSRGGTNEPGVSYANKVIPSVCAAAPTRCHFIDSDTIINMQLIDGVHPTLDGCTKLGKAVFDLMVEKGMRR